MFNFPIVPIIAFSFMIIPPIVIAFFRGWKASLFIALITLGLVGAEIGIAYAMYDFLWNTLSRFVVKDLQPGLSPDALKEVGKSSVFILFVGICLVPTYLLTMLLYFPISNKLKKHLYPKTKERNSHQKDITRKVHWLSRSSGVIIAGISSLFYASSAAAAASVLFTDKEDRNKFNDWTSDIARIYTFGNGEYGKSLMLARNFAQHDLTPENTLRLFHALYLGTKADNAQLIQDVTDMSSGKFHDALVAMKNDPEVMKAIASLIMGSNAMHGKFFLIDNSYQKRDENGNLVGTTHISTSKAKTIQQIADYFNGLPDLNFKLSSSAISKMLDVIAKSELEDYSKTGYYQQWKDGADLQETLHKRIVRLKAEKSRLETEDTKLTGELKGIYDKIDELKNKIERLGLSRDATDTYKYLVAGADAGFAGTTTTINSVGTIQTLKDDLAAIGRRFKAAKAARKLSDKVFVGTEGGNPLEGGVSKYNNDKKTAMNNAKAEMNAAQTILNTAKDLLAQKQRELATEVTRENINQAIVNRLTDTILANIKKEADDAATEASRLQGSMNAQQLDITASDRKVSVLQSKINTANQAISSSNLIISNAQSVKRDQDSIISTANSNIGTIESEINTLTSTITRNTSEITKLNNRKTSLQRDINERSKTMGSLDSVRDAARIDELTRLNLVDTTAIVNIDTDITTKTGQINTAKTDKAKKVSDKTAEKSKITNANSEKVRLAGVISEEQTKINTQNGILNDKTDAKSLEDGVNSGLKTKMSELTSQHTTQVNLNTSKTNEWKQKTSERATADTELATAISEQARLNGEIGDASKGIIKDRNDKKTILDGKTTFYNSKKADYDGYQSTFTPSENLFNKNRKTVTDIQTEITNKETEIKKQQRDKDESIVAIEYEISKRNAKLVAIYANSDQLNLIQSRTLESTPGVSTHTGEKYIQGIFERPYADPTDHNAGRVVYKPFDPTHPVADRSQTNTYYDWTKNTINGAEDYLKYAKDDTEAFLKIKEDKEKVYEEVKKEYLNALTKLLQS